LQKGRTAAFGINRLAVVEIYRQRSVGHVENIVLDREIFCEIELHLPPHVALYLVANFVDMDTNILIETAIVGCRERDLVGCTSCEMVAFDHGVLGSYDFEVARSASSHVPIQILEEHLADRAIGMSIVVILAQGIEILDREIRKPC